MAGTIKLDGTTFLTKDSSNNFTLDVGSGGTISQGTIGSNVTFSAGHVLQVVTNVDNTEYGQEVNQTPWNYSDLNTAITLKQANSKILIKFNFGAVSCQDTSNLGYAKIMFKIGSGSYSDVTPIGLNTVRGSSKHHMAVNLTEQSYQVDAGSSMNAVHTTSSAKDTVLTYAPYFWCEGVGGDVFINRNYRNGDPYDFSTISSCTLIEIAT